MDPSQSLWRIERKTGLKPATLSLEGWCSIDWATSAFPSSPKQLLGRSVFRAWAVMDSNHRRRKPAELQSAPFGHSGNCPLIALKIALRTWTECKGTNYWLISQEKSIIFSAVSAASVPLLPNFPPARSRACCLFSVVTRPKMTGAEAFLLREVIP